ncbi:hypothetical protein FGU71_09415 [Erythrobacter insulae]|uniref:Uncharacterized protein n=1 Tax=Erythrobacter insulae TaxID=2584124 RepID=A0A547PDC4_9SPHN|nr:hypothetical protein [Erythrobacter insulae]TRD12054.1 hypothetical protein FGU71_09415 [Erythrobacter insulae]
MRVIGDLIENVFGSIRLIFLLGFAAIVLFGLFMTVGATVIAPQAVNAAAERAERLGEKAIDAELEARKNYQMGQEGWGYSEPRTGSGATYQDGEAVGGWGDDD